MSNTTNYKRPKKGDIRIVLSAKQMSTLIDNFDNHRQAIEWLYKGRKWQVIKFDELKFFYFKDRVEIFAETGVAVLSI